MKLVVGLGNPGRKYEATRHNIGFVVLAELAKRHGQGRPKAAFQGDVVEAVIAGEKVLLLGPLTYMNRSGSSVRAAAAYYRLAPEELLVVCDDFNLPLAKLRVRACGSAGGQKGLADIIRHLGTEDFPRLRIGIGPVPDGWDAADFVLSRFGGEEAAEAAQAVGRAAEAAAVWVTEGIDIAMNRFN